MGTLHSPFRPFLLIVVLSVVFVFIISTGMLFSTASSLVLKYMLFSTNATPPKTTLSFGFSFSDGV